MDPVIISTKEQLPLFEQSLVHSLVGKTHFPSELCAAIDLHVHGNMQKSSVAAIEHVLPSFGIPRRGSALNDSDVEFIVLIHIELALPDAPKKSDDLQGPHVLIVVEQGRRFKELQREIGAAEQFTALRTDNAKDELCLMVSN